MTEVGQGEQSARRVLAVDSALLIVFVVAVHFSFVAQGGQGDFPLWAVALGFFAASVTLLTGVVARWGSSRALRMVALVAVAAYWVTLVTFPAAVPAEGIDRIPWTISASSAAAAAALAASGRTLAWATVIAGAAAGLIFRTLFGGLDLDGVVNDLQALLTGAVVCVIGGHMLSTGRGLDVAAASTAAAAARESAERGRLAARTRAAALVHDEVLATLTLAASGLPFPQHLLASQARNAVEMVSRLTDEQPHEPLALRAALAAEAVLCGASFTVHGAMVSTLPSATHDALVGATRQALRNSVQHAPDAVRSVSLVYLETEIRVEIVDEGPGFDPAAIGDDRLGIRRSIVERMDRIDGGSAQVSSTPATGTTVRLICAVAPSHTTDPPQSRAQLRGGVAVVAVVYVLIQAVCAIAAASVVPESWPLQFGVLVTALIAAEVLRRSPHRVPSAGRTAVVVAVAGGGLAIGAVGVHLSAGLPFAYGTMWFAVAFAFLLVAFALRGRIAVAVAGTGVIVVVLVVAGILAGVSGGLILQVSVRPAVIVGLAVALLVAVERVQRRIGALHRDAVVSAAREGWSLAARAELAGRVAELARTAVPLLQRISEGGDATDSQRREYASCEGELRDGLRAGSLAREPLTASVAAARARGVDVLLLDDSQESSNDPLTDSILLWMAQETVLAEASVVGRLLPPGRDTRATLIVDGRHKKFSSPTAAQSSVRSFHGE